MCCAIENESEAVMFPGTMVCTRLRSNDVIFRSRAVMIDATLPNPQLEINQYAMFFKVEDTLKIEIQRISQKTFISSPTDFECLFMPRFQVNQL